LWISLVVGITDEGGLGIRSAQESETIVREVDKADVLSPHPFVEQPCNTLSHPGGFATSADPDHHGGLARNREDLLIALDDGIWAFQVLLVFCDDEKECLIHGFIVEPISQKVK
jgi:hypothetical protein